MKIFIAALAATAIANELNCSNDNGGCSHTCNKEKAVCECPKCWELSDDGLTCVPASGMVSTICRANTMTMNINTCVLDGSHDYEGTDLSTGSIIWRPGVGDKLD